MTTIALDTETTGLDLRRAARPFLVTIATEDEVEAWEWDVDPLTRGVNPPLSDLRQIGKRIDQASAVVMHNAKFDVAALASVGVLPGAWPWDKTHDTVLLAHLLASNQPKNLTDLVLLWLKADIAPQEEALAEATQAARRKVQQAALRLSRGKEDPTGLGGWKIAGDDDAPDKAWQADYWLPKALAEAEGRDANDPARTVLRDYANVDSSSTLALYRRLTAEVERRGLGAIADHRRKLLPVAYGLEDGALTYSFKRAWGLSRASRKASEDAAAVCQEIARGRGVELSLPKSGKNKSLMSFVFDVLKLEPIRNPDAKTDEPLLDSKTALPYYLATLEEGGEAWRFVKALRDKRGHDTALQYLENYARYAVPLKDKPGWGLLHPDLNPTATATLRWSCKRPNEQNIRKGEDINLRAAFGPLPGRCWVSFDAQNIELRIPAYESGEQALIDLFERPDDPPYYGSVHLLNFSIVYPDVWGAAVREVGEKEAGAYVKKKHKASYYQWVKNGWFAIQYGAIDKKGGGGTADQAFHKQGAQALLMSRLGKLSALNQKWIAYANKHGRVETLPDRTVDPRRGYPLMTTRTAWGRASPTVPLNYHVQSTAMWWTCSAMIKVQALLDSWKREKAHNLPVPYEARMVLQVHDELVLDMPEGADPCWGAGGSLLPRIRAVQKVMASCGDDIGVPTPVGAEWHPRHWGEGKTIPRETR